MHTERKAQKTHRRTSKAGRAPESLESSPGATGTVLIRIADYDARAFNETTAQSIEECRQYTKTPTVTWINVEGPNSPAELEVVRQSFSVHPLVLEDIATTS
jgi:magnesium transporter